MQVLVKNSVTKKPFINTNDQSKWANFSTISDNHAEEMLEIISENEDVNIINIKLNFLMLIECFGLSWKKESSKKKKIKKDYLELHELFDLQFTEINAVVYIV